MHYLILFVLDVVIESEDWLFRIENAFDPNRLKSTNAQCL